MRDLDVHHAGRLVRAEAEQTGGYSVGPHLIAHRLPWWQSGIPSFLGRRRGRRSRVLGRLRWLATDRCQVGRLSAVIERRHELVDVSYYRAHSRRPLPRRLMQRPPGLCEELGGPPQLFYFPSR